MENKSIWSKDLKSKFYSLNENIETDILIIGGGIAGILSAFYLKDSKYKITLVDRNNLMSGVTSKMTAKVTILQDVLSHIIKDKKELYLKSQMEGMNLLKDNIEKLNIKCDFKKNDSYLYTNKNSNIKKLKDIEKNLSNLKINYSNDSLPILELKSLYDIKIDNSYEINPIKYLNEIINNLENVNIYENTNIIEVIKENKLYIARTSKFKIISKIIIFANNYPYFIKPLLFPLKVRLEKSFIAYGNSKYNGNYNLINIDKDTKSIRFYNDKMIYLTNNKYISHISNNDYDKVLNNNLINKVDTTWTNMDLITNDYLPYIGKVFNNMYIITGFNTWGILSSHIGASIIANDILKKNKYIKYKGLFSPRRSTTLQKIMNSSINILENMNGYFKGMILKNKLVYYNKNAAIYVDDKGKMYKVKRKCPHMKCNLVFNNKELTWDCPCHGSRFEINGKVINGPSKYNIN